MPENLKLTAPEADYRDLAAIKKLREESAPQNTVQAARDYVASRILELLLTRKV